MNRIREFWASGYRSLYDVRIDADRPFNVFYGPNGAGKSNILAGIEAFFGLLGHLTSRAGWVRAPENKAPYDEPMQRWLREDDRCAYGTTIETRLGVRGQWMFSEMAPPGAAEYEIEVAFDWLQKSLCFSRLRINERDLLQEPLGEHADLKVARVLVEQNLPRQAFFLSDPYRIPRPEYGPEEGGKTPPVLELLRRGELQRALLVASLHRDTQVRDRFKQFRELMQGEPLRRPPFDMTVDPQTGRIELRERFAGAGSEPADVPLDLVGLGVVQVYTIMAHLMLSGARVAGIEEPEAHLHGPSMGRNLRTLLRRVVEERILDQLFIATHSSLFDLDSTGYHEVTLDAQRGTRVTWKKLREVDRHLYEPVPAMRALRDFLSYMGEETVFHRPDGTGITTGEMIKLLEEDDELAVRFLEAAHQAAVRSVILDHKDSDDKAS